MIDSADVRKLNKNKIRKIMWKGGVWTKQTVADVTGLSVATCNTLIERTRKRGGNYRSEASVSMRWAVVPQYFKSMKILKVFSVSRLR